MLAAPPSTGALAGAGWLKRELGATFALSWPIVLVNVAISLMTVTDIMMLGWLSPRALAAGALGFNLYLPPFLFGTGVVSALSPIVASMVGAGEGAPALRRATPPGVPLRPVDRARHLDRTLAHHGHPQVDRRRTRSRRGRWDLHAGVPVEPRAKLVVLCRSFAPFSRLSGPARFWSPDWRRSPSTRSPTMPSSSDALECRRSGFSAPGSQPRFRRR